MAQGSFTLKIASAVFAAMTGFAGLQADNFGIELTPEPAKSDVRAQTDADSAAGLGESNGATTGVVVTDRAEKNKTYISGNGAHVQVKSPGFTQLLLSLHIYSQHGSDVSGVKKELESMLRLGATETTSNLWEKYGKDNSISALVRRYDLQETTTNADWTQVEVSPVDVNRATKGFLNDGKVSWRLKRSFMDILKEPAENVAGFPQSWGFLADTTAGNRNYAVKQSYTRSSKNNPPYRGGVAISNDTRFVSVMSLRWDDDKSDNEANDTISRMAEQSWKRGVPVDNKEVPDFYIKKFTDDIKEKDDSLDK